MNVLKDTCIGHLIHSSIVLCFRTVAIIYQCPLTSGWRVLQTLTSPWDVDDVVAVVAFPVLANLVRIVLGTRSNGTLRVLQLLEYAAVHRVCITCWAHRTLDLLLLLLFGICFILCV